MNSLELLAGLPAVAPTNSWGVGGCGSVVECGLPKPEMRVRFPSPAPTLISFNEINGFVSFSRYHGCEVGSPSRLSISGFVLHIFYVQEIEKMLKNIDFN